MKRSKAFISALFLGVALSFAQDEDSETLPEREEITETAPVEYVESSVDSLALMEEQIRNSCAGNTDDSICLSWMHSHRFSMWKSLDTLFCHKKESVRACALYLDSIPREKLGTYLRRLESEYLLDFSQVTEVDTVYEKQMTKGECVRDLETIVKRAKRLISEAEEDETLQFEFGECSFDGTNASKQACLKQMNTFSKNRRNECATTVVTKRTREKFEKRKSIRLFDRKMDLLWAGLWNADWFKRDTSWSDDMNFLKRMGYGYSQEKLLTQIRDAFQAKDDVWNFLLLNACSVYPNIDDAYEKMQAFRLFDCSQVLDMHEVRCDGSEMQKDVPRTMNGKQPATVVCDLETHRWRLQNDLERMNGLCSESNAGQEKKTPKGLLFCDKGWRMLSDADTWDRDFSAHRFVSGKFRPKRKYVKDNRDGKVYRVVKVGKQIWMAMNLNYASLWGSECPDDKEANCNVVGRQYNYEAAKHACPEGWKLPTVAEWNTLYETLRGMAKGKLVNQLMSVGGFVWQPAKGESAMFYWTPLQAPEDYMSADVSQTGISFSKHPNKNEMLPVRCILDNFMDENP